MLYSKLRPRNLCYGLTSKEFRCRCTEESCRAIAISPKLLDAYETFRTFIDTPLIINSGFRCAFHNWDIGGKPLSRHLVGEAIDIDAKNLIELQPVETIKFMAKKAGFTFVKYYPKKKFFHFDVRCIDES